jgi:hypothetical protein
VVADVVAVIEAVYDPVDVAVTVAVDGKVHVADDVAGDDIVVAGCRL